MRVWIQTTGIPKPPVRPISSLGHQARGWGKPQTAAFLSLRFVSFWVCVVSFTCVCIWHLFFLFVCLDSPIWRLVIAVLPSVGSGCQGAECLPCPASAALASCQAWGAGWHFCWPGSQDAKLQWASGKQGAEHLGAGARQDSSNLSGSPQGVVCLSQRCQFRVKILKLMKLCPGGGYHSLAADQYVLLNKSNTCSFFSLNKLKTLFFSIMKVWKHMDRRLEKYRTKLHVGPLCC